MKLIKIHDGLWLDPRKVIHVSCAAVEVDDDDEPIRWRIDFAFDQRVVDVFVTEPPAKIVAEWAQAINESRSMPERL